ncbi:MAG: hypothetical protein EA392_13950 [Cryomorphaceae bacterium]|nr:MAG: hypothetical protein EA392_13950 [Cryomorphaceae bacterium]
MSVHRIIECIDKHLDKNNLDSINPVVAGALLDRAGLLSDSSHRPGLPLRNLLRDGMIPHAYQPGGKGSGWVIPHSANNERDVKSVKSKVARGKEISTVKTMLSANPTLNMNEVAKELMDSRKQRAVSEIDTMVPDSPGMYCIRIRDRNVLPIPFSQQLDGRGHNIMYIGIASRSLHRRMLGQELRARGHGTFFRSMGALLGYTPPAGSLIGKRNQRNYRFSKTDETLIIEWMNRHLTVHWVTMQSGWDELETSLIAQHRPLVNLAKNPSPLPQLSELRRRCVDVACGRQV